MVTRILMPRFGETMDEGRIVKWLKKEDDSVKRGEALLEVETDKVIVQVESFGSGILREILVNEDETVPVGTLLGIITDAEENIM